MMTIREDHVENHAKQNYSFWYFNQITKQMLIYLMLLRHFCLNEESSACQMFWIRKDFAGNSETKPWLAWKEHVRLYKH